jgi:hypothetical protein
LNYKELFGATNSSRTYKIRLLTTPNFAESENIGIHMRHKKIMLKTACDSGRECLSKMSMLSAFRNLELFPKPRNCERNHLELNTIKLTK